VGKVRPGSQAHRAGLQKGDVITQIGNHPIPDAPILVDISRRLAAGQQVPVRFIRDGRMRDTMLTIGAR
jgi:S1-C subfamily serine protease